MNVQTIVMDRHEAQERLRSYRTQLHRRADAEYSAIAQGYEALAAGTPLISLTDAIRAGGIDEQGRPRLAIARADRRQVHVRWAPGSEFCTFDTRRSSAESPTLVRGVPLGLHGRTHPQHGYGLTLQGYALVPIIPADVRERSGVSPSRDREHYILFEVEQWANAPLRAEPDRDPYLLRHLGGDLYAVLAEWDLTDVERLVMAGRREARA